MKSIQPSVRRVSLVALATVLVALAVPSLQLWAEEPASPGYSLDWWTVDGGGQTGGDGSGYVLQGSIGQPDAAVWHGGDYTLAGGFWSGASLPPLRVYLPMILR